MWGFPFPLVLNTKLILMKLILGQSFFVHFLLFNMQHAEQGSAVCCVMLPPIGWNYFHMENRCYSSSNKWG